MTLFEIITERLFYVENDLLSIRHDYNTICPYGTDFRNEFVKSKDATLYKNVCIAQARYDELSGLISRKSELPNDYVDNRINELIKLYENANTEEDINYCLKEYANLHTMKKFN